LRRPSCILVSYVLRCDHGRGTLEGGAPPSQTLNPNGVMHCWNGWNITSAPKFVNSGPPRLPETTREAVARASSRQAVSSAVASPGPLGRSAVTDAESAGRAPATPQPRADTGGSSPTCTCAVYPRAIMQPA